MKITIKDVEYVAKLAQLELTEQEKKEYTIQLNSILEYMDELNKVDTSNVLSTASVIKIKNVFREDKIKKSDIAEDIISNAPSKEDRFFKVKKVIE
ncbi:MAG: Asp-tRNA(Asn)/Glu-tRNA(Gln) amidotransferase subunit GatC [Elusimicrobiota bacterium]